MKGGEREGKERGKGGREKGGEGRDGLCSCKNSFKYALILSHEDGHRQGKALSASPFY